MTVVHDDLNVLTDRDRQDELLYDRFGRQLESEHTGEFIAISDDGQLILGADELTLTQLAVARFGAGHYALRKIGAVAEGPALVSTT
jgi:hypothetical protein